jgi:hypothetical protein
MNKKYIQYNLEEAQEEIEVMLRSLKQKPDYTHEEFFRSMQHLIHHINIAWNARSTSTNEIENATPADLERWGQFPADIKLI